MTEYQIDYGEGDIQDLADLILTNALYIDINSLNYVIASRGHRPKAEYRRYLHYVTVTVNGEIVALCMLVEQGDGEAIEGDFHYYSDAFYSIYVKPEHRKKGYALLATKTLSVVLADYFLVRKALYNRYSVMADLKGAPIARKYFDVPVVCGGFPTHQGIRRVAARIHSRPFDDEGTLSPQTLASVEPRDVLLAQYTKDD